jgi:uncharacterized protein (TIGR02391 family)
MAKRYQPPPPPEPRNFASVREVDLAIGKLRRRRIEVEQLDPAQVRFDDPRVQTAESNIRNTILDVFGPASPEYDEHKHHDIDAGPHYVSEDPAYTQECFKQGRIQTLGLLDGLMGRLAEKRADLEQPHAQPKAEFRSRTLHPTIVKAADRLFDDGHYALAVFEAAKALIEAVRQKCRRTDLDGAPLMRAVFSANSPTLAFNALQGDSDRAEQEGLMHLFEGAVLAIRDPRAHRAGMTDDPTLALEYLSLLSLLAGRLDAATLTP